MKTVKVEIQNTEGLKALRKLEQDGLIKLTNFEDYDSALSKLAGLGESETEYSIGDKKRTSDQWDLDEELAKKGFTMQEIVDEVKAVRKELYNKKSLEDRS